MTTKVPAHVQELIHKQVPAEPLVEPLVQLEALLEQQAQPVVELEQSAQQAEVEVLLEAAILT